MREVFVHIDDTTIEVRMQTMLWHRAIHEEGGKYHSDRLVAGLFCCSSSSAKALITAFKMAGYARWTKKAYVSMQSDASVNFTANIIGMYAVKREMLPDNTTWVVSARAVEPEYLIGDYYDETIRWLMSDRFTTPMLPHWGKKIADEMRSRKLIEELNGFGAYGYVGKACDADLDNIVSNLTVERKVRFYESRTQL